MNDLEHARDNSLASALRWVQIEGRGDWLGSILAGTDGLQRQTRGECRAVSVSFRPKLVHVFSPKVVQ